MKFQKQTSALEKHFATSSHDLTTYFKKEKTFNTPKCHNSKHVIFLNLILRNYELFQLLHYRKQVLFQMSY